MSARVIRVLFWVVLGLLAALGWRWLVIQPPALNGHSISTIEYVHGLERTPPAAGWSEKSLPFYSPNYENLYDRRGFVRFEFNKDDLAAGANSLAFGLLKDTADVYLNGLWLGTFGRVETPPVNMVPRNRFWPLAIALPEQALQPTNTILLHLSSSSSIDIDNIVIGPSAQILPEVERVQWLRRDVLQQVSSFILLVAGLMGLLWWFYREGKEYLYIGLALLFWWMNILASAYAYFPVTAEFFRWFTISGQLFYVAGLFGFILHFCKLTSTYFQRAHRGVWATSFVFFISISATLFPSRPEIFWPIYEYGITVWTGLVGLGSVGLLLWVTVRSGKRNHRFITFASVVALALGLHDLALMAHVIQGPRYFLANYGMLVLLLTFIGILTYRFASALRKSERFREQLEIEVAQKTAHLVQQQDTIRTLERQSAQSEERERIMQDVHDGIGGQLTNLVSQIQHQSITKVHIADRLNQSILDLRLILDALNPNTESALVFSLGQLRNRLQPLFSGSSIKLVWETATLSEDIQLSVTDELNVFRIIQEAVNNALKYSQASIITVRVAEQDDKLSISVEDNGVGFDPSHDSDGFGLTTMRNRAKKLQADFRVDGLGDNPGTQIHLTIPLKF